MEVIKKRLGNLLSVKSLVTLVLTAVFAYMAIVGKISQDFMTIYAVIIAFYFGTQSQKMQDAVERRARRGLCRIAIRGKIALILVISYCLGPEHRKPRLLAEV